MIMHVILKDGFGTDIAQGDLTIINDTDTEQLKEWLGTQISYPLLHSTPHPQFPLTISVTFS